MAAETMGKKTGWNEEHEKILREQLSLSAERGETLKSAFEATARLTGRRPNSIRNYYYANLSDETTQSRRAYRSFTPAEAEELARYFARGCAQGLSVRACALQLSGGDKRLMLRYQNKYRALVRSAPEMVRRVREKAGSAVKRPKEIGIQQKWNANELSDLIQREIGAAMETLRQNIRAEHHSQAERIRNIGRWLDAFLQCEDAAEKERLLARLRTELHTAEMGAENAAFSNTESSYIIET